MTPTEIAALRQTFTFPLDLTVARGAKLDLTLNYEGLPLSGETLLSRITDVRNGAVLDTIAATVESYTTPTYSALKASHPEFQTPDGLQDTDSARLAVIRLQFSAAQSAILPSSKTARGSDVKFHWDVYAVTNLQTRLFAGTFTLSEGSSYV